MGVENDIRWMKEFEDRVDMFALIAREGPMKVRKIRESLDFGDWWPVKYHIKALSDKDLVEEVEGGYSLTENGKKVFESLKTVSDIESI